MTYSSASHRQSERKCCTPHLLSLQCTASQRQVCMMDCCVCVCVSLCVRVCVSCVCVRVCRFAWVMFGLWIVYLVFSPAWYHPTPWFIFAQGNDPYFRGYPLLRQ